MAGLRRHAAKANTADAGTADLGAFEGELLVQGFLGFRV